jgi:aryl-alcohol dehydrogenase-like predicted oxidoreductase
MELRPLGNTGLKVTRLGLGLAALGRPGYMTLGHADDLGRRYDPSAMERHAHEVLNAAYAVGIRYFDVARSYGQGERFLGTWLAESSLSTNDVTVGSKWGYTYTADWKVDAKVHEVKEHSRDVLRRQFGESLQLLGSYLAIYHIHSATLESGVLENIDVLRDLAAIKARGMVIGLTVTGVGQSDTIRRALDVAIDGVPLFGCVQATWNVLEPSAGPALAEARAAGRGVIVKEALANGRLTSRNEDPAFAGKRQVLAGLAARYEATIDALCLAAAMMQSRADVVLSGAATVKQVRSNAAALEVTLGEEARTTLAGLAQRPPEYWSQRAGLRWN